MKKKILSFIIFILIILASNAVFAAQKEDNKYFTITYPEGFSGSSYVSDKGIYAEFNASNYKVDVEHEIDIVGYVTDRKKYDQNNNMTNTEVLNKYVEEADKKYQKNMKGKREIEIKGYNAIMYRVYEEMHYTDIYTIVSDNYIITINLSAANTELLDSDTAGKIIKALNIKDTYKNRNQYFTVNIPDKYIIEDGGANYDPEYAPYAMVIYNDWDEGKGQLEGYYDYYISVCYPDCEVRKFSTVKSQFEARNKSVELVFEGETIFNGYKAHKLSYKSIDVGSPRLDSKYYIYSDNYCYVLEFASYDVNFESTKECKEIVSTFRIKDTVIKNTGTPFTDVAIDSWYRNAVKYAYENNMIKGYDKITFAPEDKLTRGQLVTILHRMEKSPKVTGTSKFADVQDSNQYYYNAVIWATNNKIVSGYDNGKFGAEDNITREQLAVILWKYAKYKKMNVSATNDLSNFTDTKKISSWALSQVKWAVGAGVITGNADKTLNPTGNATRAEVAAMLEKYCKRVRE